MKCIPFHHLKHIVIPLHRCLLVLHLNYAWSLEGCNLPNATLDGQRVPELLQQIRFQWLLVGMTLGILVVAVLVVPLLLRCPQTLGLHLFARLVVVVIVIAG